MTRTYAVPLIVEEEIGALQQLLHIEMMATLSNRWARIWTAIKAKMSRVYAKGLDV
jgi:hypothetical protein